ncbi:hypothetical protein EVAR_72901_1, partial [Eumeta japonica]
MRFKFNIRPGQSKIISSELYRKQKKRTSIQIDTGIGIKSGTRIVFESGAEIEMVDYVIGQNKDERFPFMLTRTEPQAKTSLPMTIEEYHVPPFGSNVRPFIAEFDVWKIIKTKEIKLQK